MDLTILIVYCFRFFFNKKTCIPHVVGGACEGGVHGKGNTTLISICLITQIEFQYLIIKSRSVFYVTIICLKIPKYLIFRDGWSTGVILMGLLRVCF